MDALHPVENSEKTIIDRLGGARKNDDVLLRYHEVLCECTQKQSLYLHLLLLCYERTSLVQDGRCFCRGCGDMLAHILTCSSHGIDSGPDGFQLLYDREIEGKSSISASIFRLNVRIMDSSRCRGEEGVPEGGRDIPPQSLRTRAQWRRLSG